MKFDHDTVITSIPYPVGDEGENTSRGVRIVSAAYGNTEPPTSYPTASGSALTWYRLDIEEIYNQMKETKLQ